MAETVNRLRIALQKSGRLSEDSFDLLQKAGLKVRVRSQRLVALAENFPVEVLLVRDDDIPGLVMDGTVDLGIVGEGVLEETKLSRARVECLLYGVPSAGFRRMSPLDRRAPKLDVARGW